MLTQIMKLCEHGKTYKDELLGAGLVSFLTFIAGALFDYSYRGLNPLGNPALLVSLAISGPLLIWWFLSTDRAYQRLAKALMKSRFRDPKIGVLSLSGVDDSEVKSLLRATVYTPDVWHDRLTSAGLKVDKVTDLTMKDDYSVILNPFGELYLEEDTTNLKTFQRIKDYVKRGGVFVNAAGLAFFYMWSPKTKVEALTGPMLETYSGRAVTKPVDKDLGTYESSVMLQPIVITDDSSLVETWLHKSFGVRTTLGNERTLKVLPVDSFRGLADGDVNVQEFRSALRCESLEGRLVPLIRSEYVYQPTGRKHECYPLAAVRYGIGYLILVGIVLKEEQDLSLVVRAIKTIAKRLNEKGLLESDT